MLTVKDLSTITLELLLNRAPSLHSPEAQQAREEIAADLKALKAAGVAPILPDDFEG